jgi:transcription initiation factor TFIID subunit 1, fungi type
MEYHRRGPHQGFWRLKPNLTIPSDAEMLKMVVPESVVLMESMQVGQRHLQDSGYGMTTEAAAEDDDESSLSIEQQLAPWITTKNFLHATQAKAMLRLHGDGDPTGRGEAFSFIRISMKDIFVRAGEDYESKLRAFSRYLLFPSYAWSMRIHGSVFLHVCPLSYHIVEAENRPKSAHRYNVAEQQQIYKSEIERIWNAQFDSLSRKDEPELTAEDIRRYEEAEQEINNNNNKKARGQSQTRQASLRPDGMDGAVSQPSPSVSRASSVERGREGSMGPDTNRRVLRIKRLVNHALFFPYLLSPHVFTCVTDTG